MVVLGNVTVSSGLASMKTKSTKMYRERSFVKKTRIEKAKVATRCVASSQSALDCGHSAR